MAEKLSPSGLSEAMDSIDMDHPIEETEAMETVAVDKSIIETSKMDSTLMDQSIIESMEGGQDLIEDDNLFVTESELLKGDTDCPTPSSSILNSPSHPLDLSTHPYDLDPSISEFAKELEEMKATEFDTAAVKRMEPEWKRSMKRTRKETERTIPPLNRNYKNNNLLKRHPSGDLICIPDNSWKKYIDSTTSDIPFRPISWTGYSTKKYVDTLYPRHSKRPRKTPKLNAYDFMSFESTVEFREYTHRLISESDNGYFRRLHNSQFQIFDLSRKQTKTSIAPTTDRHERQPVLYQVVRRDQKAEILILEAKDFFVFLDGREELRLLRLTMHSTDILNCRTGIDIHQMSISDLVWVHDVEMAPAARTISKRRSIMDSMRKAENSLIYSKVPSVLFNVTHFSLVTPATSISRTLGILTDYHGDINGTPKKAEIVMEQNTASCTINMDLVPFTREEVPKESLIWADAREPTSHSCRFSATPIGIEASEALHSKVATIWPIRIEESPTPIGIHKIDDKSLGKIMNRIEGFSDYSINPQESLSQLAHAYNVSCARLADAANNTDDKSWHHVDVSLIKASPNFISFYGILENRFHEAGYVRGRQLITLIEGFSKAYLMNIEKSELLTRGKTRDLAIYFTCHPKSTTEFFGELRRIKKEDARTMLISFRLNDNSEQSDPLSAYMIRINDIPLDLDVNGGQIIHRTFSKIIPTEEVDDVSTVDTENLRFDHVVPDESAYGSGKTLTLALLATLAAIKQVGNRIVIITAVTNSGVAQAMNTVNQITDYRMDVVPLRFVSDNAAQDHPTDVDIVKILETLEQNHALDMTIMQLARLREFLERRKIMSQLKSDRSLMDISLADQEEYKIAETRCSMIARSIIQMMLEIRKPNVIGITLSALLNGSDKGGILESYLAKNEERIMIINDESSQTPEPALTAIALRFPKATLRFFGDRHQLQPYCRIKKNTFAARCGARGLASILSEASDIPKVTLAETFRSHPKLNELPNRMFYNGHLISGAAEETRDQIMKKFNLPHPCVFVNIKSEAKTMDGGTSLKNDKEAQFALRMVTKLLTSGVNNADIGVICIYNEQKKYMQSLNPKLNVYTVDSVQGKEFEIVLLLTTKTTQTYNYFMDEPTRTNVAITRARSALMVLGESRALAATPLWNSILNFAKSKKAYIEELDAYTHFNI